MRRKAVETDRVGAGARGLLPGGFGFLVPLFVETFGRWGGVAEAMERLRAAVDAVAEVDA